MTDEHDESTCPDPCCDAPQVEGEGVIAQAAAADHSHVNGSPVPSPPIPGLNRKERRRRAAEGLPALSVVPPSEYSALPERVRPAPRFPTAAERAEWAAEQERVARKDRLVGFLARAVIGLLAIAALDGLVWLVLALVRAWR